MPTTDRTLDWGTIAKAGIYNSLVERETNHGMPELEQYAARRPGDPDFRLLFGEDPDEGWNTYLEERGDDGWVSAGQSPDWYATPGEVLAAVAQWIVLGALNDYAGDNIWEDVIYRLAYDEAATNAVEHGDGRDVVIAGVHYRHEGGRWTVRA